MTLYRPIILLIVVFLAGCALQPPTEKAMPTVLDTRSGRWMTPAELPKPMAKADYVVIGEMHQNLRMQEALINLLDTLKHNQALDVLVLDILKPHLQSSANSYLEQLESLPPALADRYRPLVRWAEDNDVILVGGSTPREKLTSLKSPEGQQWLKQQTQNVLSEQQLQTLNDTMKEAHPDSTQTDYMVSAQQLIDYFMARTLAVGKHQSVLITRAFHARKDLGVQPYLHKLKPDARIISVLMLGTSGDENVSPEVLESARQHYDFVWLQQAEPRLLIAPKPEELSGLNQKTDNNIQKK